MSRRVLLVTNYYPPHVGGVEVVAAAEARGLRARGARVEVLTSRCGAARGRVGADDGVRVTRSWAWNGLEARGVAFPVFSPAVLVTAWRAVRRADIVHLHDAIYLLSWVVALVCRVQRRRYLVTVHVGEVAHPSRVVMAVQRCVRRTFADRVLRGADRVLAITEHVGARAVAGRDWEVLRNGVDTELYRPPVAGEREALRVRHGLTDDRPVALFVGRFVPKKGFADVLATAAATHRLVFVGGDRPAGLGGDHLFLGSLAPAEVARVYRLADVFVDASVGECPMTVREAMASGLPVLANDEPGHHGLGLETSAAVELVDVRGGRLPDAVRRLLGDHPERQRRGELARKEAETAHSWSAHLDRLELLQTQILGGRA